ncbi:hypothetical protein MXB_3345, partial [Myxobolus squamalis]
VNFSLFMKKSYLKDVSEMNEETIVILREPLLKDKLQLTNDIVKNYSNNLCTFNESLTCGEISDHIRARVCAFKSNYLGNISCTNLDDSAAIQQRDVLEITVQDHNLYTYAEFNSNYPFVFCMCFGVAIVLISSMIVLLLTLSNIDLSAYSIFYKDTPTKQKSD